MHTVSLRRFYPLLLIGALLLNATLPFFAVAMQDASAPVRQLYSVIGDRILICNGNGFAWVKLADLQSGKEKPGHHSDSKCALCYAAASVAKAVGATPIYVVAFYPHVSSVFACYGEAFTTSYVQSLQRVRAPPYSFIA